MKSIITIFLLQCISYAVFSQQLTQTIRGKIIDEQTRFPIIGATVYLKDTQPVVGTISDVNGYFSIENVPVGRRSLIISSVGYVSATLNEILVGSAKEVIVTVRLKESVTQMEEIVVSAEKQQKGQPINDLATVSSISISVEETSRYAGTFDDPARAALSYAGVSTGGDDLLNEIVIRGNSPKGILWRLEGVEIPNPNHFANIGSSAGGISMLSNNVMSTSDFFTGAFTSQYGNATSGVFDINLRQGNYEQHEHSFQAGLLGLAFASEGPINREKRSTYVANYRYSTLALFDKMGLEILGNQEEVTFQDLSFKMYFPTKLGTFSVWGLGGHNTYRYLPQPEVGDWWNEKNTHYMGAGGVTHIGYIDKNTYVESVISFSSYEIDNLIDSLSLQLEEDEQFRESTLRFSSYLVHKFNSQNSIRIGGIISLLNFNLESKEWISEENELITYLDTDGTTSTSQIYANWQFQPTQFLNFNFGVHTTYFDLNGDVYLEPRMGARYQLNSSTALTAGLGLHSRMESLGVYMGETETEGGSIIFNNRNLGFTRAFHAVGGLEKMIGSDMRFKAEVYYQYLYDVPIWGTDTTTNDYLLTFSAINTYDGYTSEKLENDGTGKNYGVELTLEKFFTNSYYFMTTASIFESQYIPLDGIERNTRFNGNYVFNAIGGKEFYIGNNGQNVLGLNSRMIWSGGKRQAPILLDESRQEGYTVFDFERNFEQRLSDYWRLDVSISYRINKVKTSSVFAVSIQNATGRPNEYGRWYSNETGGIISSSQVGVFPNVSYKIEF